MKYVLLIAAILVISGCNNRDGYILSVPGAQGPTGAPGNNGSSCSVTGVSANTIAPNGGALLACTDGTSTLILNGTNGSNGTNGTVVAPIQFCVGTTVYPSNFEELGFCINNKLYAVYSANNGFLTEIVPGTYQSNAIGNTCTFTVAANCQVSN